jgi:tRNA G46 methylase TrmB
MYVILDGKGELISVTDDRAYAEWMLIKKADKDKGCHVREMDKEQYEEFCKQSRYRYACRKAAKAMEAKS